MQSVYRKTKTTHFRNIFLEIRIQVYPQFSFITYTVAGGWERNLRREAILLKYTIYMYMYAELPPKITDYPLKSRLYPKTQIVPRKPRLSPRKPRLSPENPEKR